MKNMLIASTILRQQRVLAAACQVICRALYSIAYEKQADTCPPFSYVRVLPEETMLSWTDFCSGSVSPVSTGTFCTLLNDLSPPSYPEYFPSFLLHITRAGIHNQKKTLLSWTDLCSVSVSPVSTGTLSTLLSDLPPPSYPEYSPSFLFTRTSARIHKQKNCAELNWLLFRLCIHYFRWDPQHSLQWSATSILYPGYLPSFLFATTRAGIHKQKKLCWAELTCVQALYRLFLLGPSAPSYMICHLHPIPWIPALLSLTYYQSWYS